MGRQLWRGVQALLACGLAYLTLRACGAGRGVTEPACALLAVIILARGD